MRDVALLLASDDEATLDEAEAELATRNVEGAVYLRGVDPDRIESEVSRVAVGGRASVVLVEACDAALASLALTLTPHASSVRVLGAMRREPPAPPTASVAPREAPDAACAHPRLVLPFTFRALASLLTPHGFAWLLID